MAELDPLSRLESLYNQTLDGLDAVRRVGEILGETFDEKEICQKAVRIFVEYLPFENCSILLLDDSRTTLRLQAGGGKADEHLDDRVRRAFNRNLEIKVGEGIAGEVVTTGRPVLITNAGRNPRFKPLPSPIPIRSLLCLPLHSKDSIIGVINLSHPEIEEISIDQEKTLEVLSRMVGQCITISRLNSELIAEKLQHSERLITLGQLSASVAHEVNNPLTNILLRSQKLQRAKGISDKDLSMAAEIQEESERIATILTSVLDFSRMKRPARSGGKRADVHASIQRTLSLTTPLMADKHSVEVTQELADALPNAAADSYDLEQVFTNLITNAIQSMRGKGQLHISTHRIPAPSHTAPTAAKASEAQQQAIDARRASGEEADGASREAGAPHHAGAPHPTGDGAHHEDGASGDFDHGNGAEAPASAGPQSPAQPTSSGSSSDQQNETIDSGERIEIRFRDSGCGMTEDQIESIFEPFFTTRQDEGGTGLGLSICRKIIRDCNGELSVISKPGKGTTFTVSLPCVAKPGR